MRASSLPSIARSCLAATLACAGAISSSPAQEPPATGSTSGGEDAPAPGAGGDATPWLRGTLWSRYRGRFRAGESDHELRETLALELGHAESDLWTGSLLVEALADLDGHESRSSAFHALDDTLDGAVDGRVYEAWGEYHGSKDLSVARVGRQIVYDTPVTLWFDGARLETRELGGWHTRFGAQGGVPARIYEATHSGDVVADLFVSARPGPDTRVRFDWLHLEDDELLGPRRDDLLSLSVGQTLDARARIDARASMLEGEARDAELRASWYDAESDLSLQASWYELFQEQNQLPLEIDPFTEVLLAQFPYQQARLMGSKSFGGGWSVQAGFDARRVNDGDDIGAFNRDFDRGFATVNAAELLPGELALGVTGEVWDADGSDIRTWGLDVSRAIGSRWRVSVGTYYALFKTDLTLLEEREDVRTYFVRARWEQSDELTFDALAEHEDSIDQYETLRLEVTWRF